MPSRKRLSEKEISEEKYKHGYWRTDRIVKSLISKPYLLKVSSLRYQILTNYLKKMPKNEKMLDLGCGFGYKSFFFKRIGFNVIGVDISKHAIFKAREGTLE
jgi:SAM-dependent methyltransferase